MACALERKNPRIRAKMVIRSGRLAFGILGKFINFNCRLYSVVMARGLSFLHELAPGCKVHEPCIASGNLSTMSFVKGSFGTLLGG